MFQNWDNYITVPLDDKVETVTLIPKIEHDFILFTTMILEIRRDLK
jgi:hypothetical protein